MDRRVFEPAETITLNFITLSALDDSKISQKDMSLLGKSSDDSRPELSGSFELHLEEVEEQHLGCSSHSVDIVCGAEQTDRDSSRSQHKWLSSTMPTGEAEYKILTDFYRVGEDQQFCGQGTAARAGELSEPQVALANSDSQQENLHHLRQLRPGSEDQPEEEPSTTLVDWDPQTGRLCIPSLPGFVQDPEGYGHCERDQLSEDDLLYRLYENHMTDKSDEEKERYLMQFMEEWELHIEMES